MKNIIILSASALLAVTICIAAVFGVTNYIQASGPSDSDRPYIMYNDNLYETKSSCAQNAFDNIAADEGFVLSELTITDNVKSNEVPTKNLFTNYKIFKGQEIYSSSNKPNELYIKAIVNNEVRYYLFTVTDSNTAEV